jgi:acetyltransferase
MDPKTYNPHGQFDPSIYREYWTDKAGRMLVFRSITAEDKQLERAFVDGLSPETSRYRFFHWIKKATDEMIEQLCDIDPDREVAIMAEYTINGKKTNVGVARLFPDSDLRGEFTIVAADDFHGCGLGRKFMEILIWIARKKGLKSIYGTVLPDNNRMLSLMKNLGFSIGKNTGGEVDVVLDI